MSKQQEIKHPGRALAILFGIMLILAMCGVFDSDNSPKTTTQNTDNAVAASFETEKGAAWQQGTKLLTDKLWNPDFAEWSKIPDSSSVFPLGPHSFLIGGTVRTKNAYGERIENLFSATVECDKDKWQLVKWEFEEI